MNDQMHVKLDNGVEMPMAGIGAFLLTPNETEVSALSAQKNGCRLIGATPERLKKYVEMIPDVDGQK